MKKVIAGFLACIMSLSLIACGSSAKSAVDVMTAVQDARSDNYVLTGTLNMTVLLVSGGINFDMPVGINLTGSVFQDDSVMESVVSTSILGQDITDMTTTYSYDGNLYTLMSSTGEWTCSDAVDSDSIMSPVDIWTAFCNPERFSNADVVYSDGIYTITADVLDILGEDGSSDMFNLDEMLPSEEASDDIGGALSGGKLVYTINDSYQVLSVVMDETSGTNTYEEDGVSYDGTVSLSMNFDFEGYGSVVQSDVVPPAEALKLA